MSASNFFQRLTKLHKPVEQVQFMVFEKIHKYFAIPNCTRYNIYEKIQDSLS